MNIKIKYCVAVAAVMVATAFCGCDDEASELIPVENIREETVAEDSGRAFEVSEDTAEAKEKKTARVYVCGAVRSPDVYVLEEDMRVVDAVAAAGGFTDDAGTDYLNLAEPVNDGQKIYIPTTVEIEEALSEGAGLYGSLVNITTNTPGIESGSDGNNPSQSDALQPDSEGKVDINSADKATLMTLPGIGESKADKIIDYRQQNGGFSSIEDIMLVGGIKEGLFNKVKDRICVR